MSSTSIIKEAITKVKVAMSGEEEKKETKTMKNMKEAMSHLKIAQSNFKLAQEEGSMGPDDAKEISEEISQLSSQITEAAMSIAEGVPSSEGGGMESGMGGEEKPNPMGEKSEASPMATPPTEGGEEEEKKDKMQIASMQKTIDGMVQKEAKVKLSQDYARIFPESMQVAKAQEFMARTDSISILTAKVEEAKSILSEQSQQTMKLAQYGNSKYDIIPNNGTAVEAGGKV